MSNVIDFRSASGRRRQVAKPAILSRMFSVEIEQEPEQPACDEGELTVTCQNLRLRQARSRVWRQADATRDYWKARARMEDVIRLAQSHGLPEGDNHRPR
ncbi:MAG: hypothetical protein JWQ49_6669 [Edaphobacter sp.]|nr:hypothetical protein [Edaphobacter sp.]